MIYDLIKNSEKYQIITPEIKAFISQKDLKPGRYNLSNGVFALKQEYDTKSPQNTDFESHIKYIDVQCILSGQEIIDITPVYGLKEKISYDSEKDIIFYEDGKIEDVLSLKMKPGTFAVIYPEEAHKPCLHWDNASFVSKIVIKIPV